MTAAVAKSNPTNIHMSNQSVTTAVNAHDSAGLKRLRDAMHKYWGYDTFRPMQEQAMQCGLEHRDSLVVLPTGGGKSLCFQVPAVCHDGLTIVVSPLISLMKDQVDTLVECGVSAAQLNSSLGAEEKRSIDRDIRDGKLKLLYVAPERLANDAMLSYLKQMKIAMIAVDEAHCISAWGHDFRAEYRMLGKLKDHFPGVAIHAYTATASAAVQSDIIAQLNLNQPQVLIGNYDRPNLTYRVLPAENRFGQTVDIIKKYPNLSGIVYCISRKEVDRMAGALDAIGIKALPYHAGLGDQERKDNQDAFLNDRCSVIIATVAFGMGIDKPDVRFVIHAGVPKSIEHYQQESGRAGRDGLEAECTLIHSAGDFVAWSRIFEGSSPDNMANQIRQLDTIRNYCCASTCRHRLLVEYFGQKYENQTCKSCDVCLDEIDMMEDSLRISQMIISCVVRLNQRFGSDYTAKVLTGSGESKISDNGHQSLSTFGLLKEHRIESVKIWIDQLVGQGFLRRSQDRFPVLTVSESGRELLKGNASVSLSKPNVTASRQTVAEDSWAGVDRGLFDRLKVLRSVLAAERNVPAFVIFNDVTLRILAARKPSTLEKFGQVQGVGAKKLEDLGEQFLAVIIDYFSEYKIDHDAAVPESINQGASSAKPRSIATAVNSSSVMSFPYWQQSLSIDEVCKKTGRARSTVIAYLNDYIRENKIIDATAWIEKPIIESIEEAIKTTGERVRLRPLLDHCDGQVTYDDLRLVLSCYNNRFAEELE